MKEVIYTLTFCFNMDYIYFQKSINMVVLCDISIQKIGGILINSSIIIFCIIIGHCQFYTSIIVVSNIYTIVIVDIRICTSTWRKTCAQKDHQMVPRSGL